MAALHRDHLRQVSLYNRIQSIFPHTTVKFLVYTATLNSGHLSIKGLLYQLHRDVYTTTSKKRALLK